MLVRDMKSWPVVVGGRADFLDWIEKVCCGSKEIWPEFSLKVAIFGLMAGLGGDWPAFSMFALTIFNFGARVLDSKLNNFLVALLPFGLAIFTYKLPFLRASGGMTAWFIRSVFRLVAPSD